ncbi:hydrogenase maturation protease [Streptosporangium saharense]|uniref:Hydrogenase maturation protease n=1 Tax=Streptosporangium saharense TaxID=1706840 RepID=A0A7W7VRU8_9ACTN|nr:hydrogenase maturation protease [Streptosporangium saharense]MBB4919934.1 hydrogenase maturation protease [Streptosporangium saharense]
MRILVAGVGNVFFGDDGFGVEVVRLLDAEGPPEGAVVADFGIRGVHLAYELLAGYDSLILIDAVPRGESPGTLSVIEPGIERGTPDQAPLLMGALGDSHSMTPDAVFALFGPLGVSTERVLLVGCEPADTSPGMGLSQPVADAVPVAVGLVRELVAEQVAAIGSTERGRS